MLTATIVERITRAIFQHALPPGAKLNERDLAAIFDTSRTIVRQALIRLAENKLVVIEPNRGAFVVKPTLEEAHDLFATLIWFEKALIEEVARNLTPAKVAALRTHTAGEDEAQARGDHRRADEMGVEFHLLLSRMVGNPVIEEIHRDLMWRQRVISGVYKTEFDYCQLRNEHDVLIDLLEKGAVKRAQKLLETHYRLVVKGHVSNDHEERDLDLARILAG